MLAATCDRRDLLQDNDADCTSSWNHAKELLVREGGLMHRLVLSLMKQYLQVKLLSEIPK